MREIKFRVWDKYEEKWMLLGTMEDLLGIYHSGVNGHFKLYTGPHENEVAVMQFTGLYDKNGKEIYEGDIIQFAKNSIGIVVFENGRFRHTGETEIHGALYWDTVIGNIYENGDLLNGRR